MKKNLGKKLVLARETLRILESELQNVAGGDDDLRRPPRPLSKEDTRCTSCDAVLASL